MMQPSVARTVHYVSHGTPVRADGTQAFASLCRAATVTEVDETNGLWLGLCVINPTGLFFHSLADGGCHYDPTGQAGGTWHEPERIG